jgi:nucleoside-diphosphate-sugar epimerase
MKITVIGAGGFVGQHIVARLQARQDIADIRAVDRVTMPEGPKTTRFIGDFAQPDLRDAALAGADAVIFLAAILGGAAEADHALARRVNLDATLDLIDHLKDTAPGIRFVNASTVAVYGASLPDPCTDQTPLEPELLYGAQKLMIEVLLSTYAKRGWLDALSLRPAGVMARDGADAALKSAFMSRLFHAVRRGEDITLPVGENDRSWMASVESVAQNFIHAAVLPDPGPNRAFSLPALSVRFGDLVTALRRRFPDSPSRVSYAPEPQIVAMFGNHPELVTETAMRLGFLADADADMLVARVFP